jgi:serine/threonine protein kinase
VTIKIQLVSNIKSLYLGYLNFCTIGQQPDDAEDEGARLRRKAQGKFYLNDFKFLSTLGTGTFGRVRLVKHKSDPAEAEPLALKCLKKSEIIRLK